MGGRGNRQVASGLGAGVFLAGAAVVRRWGVTKAEARLFQVINGKPNLAVVPVWAVMQAGSLAGALATSAASAVLCDRRLGRRMALVSSLTWAGAKAVKPFIRRGRPAAVVDMATIRGRAQSGLGYPSGHAAVAVSLAITAAPHLPRRWRTPAWVAALVVGPARVYVGAHLPLDVVGGIAFGLAVGAAARGSVADVDPQPVLDLEP